MTQRTIKPGRDLIVVGLLVCLLCLVPVSDRCGICGNSIGWTTFANAIIHRTVLAMNTHWQCRVADQPAFPYEETHFRIPAPFSRYFFMPFLISGMVAGMVAPVLIFGSMHHHRSYHPALFAQMIFFGLSVPVSFMIFDYCFGCTDHRESIEKALGIEVQSPQRWVYTVDMEVSTRTKLIHFGLGCIPTILYWGAYFVSEMRYKRLGRPCTVPIRCPEGFRAFCERMFNK